jgi:hypothetical protein
LRDFLSCSFFVFFQLATLEQEKLELQEKVEELTERIDQEKRETENWKEKANQQQVTIAELEKDVCFVSCCNSSSEL